MAFPKKRGLRRITVNDVVYRWRFSGGELEGAISIYGPNSGGKVLVIKSKEWFDLWLSYPFALSKAPEIVTPAIVRRAIEFALENGWDISARGGALTFWFFDAEFHADEPDEETVNTLRQSQFKTSRDALH